MKNLMTVEELIKILENHDKNECVYLYSWVANNGEYSGAELSFDMPPYETIMECEN